MHRRSGHGGAEEDCVAAHYRVVAEADGSQRFVGLSSLERGLDKDLKFFELDAAGNKVRLLRSRLFS